jgi:hypothetical protein
MTTQYSNFFIDKQDKAVCITLPIRIKLITRNGTNLEKLHSEKPISCYTPNALYNTAQCSGAAGTLDQKKTKKKPGKHKITRKKIKE